MKPNGSRVSGNGRSGVSLVEVVVGVAVFAILAVGIYQAYQRALIVSRATRQKVVATALANEMLEIVRNLSYADVGTISGIPPGVILQLQTLIRDGIPFEVRTTIRNIDDPFDGTIGGSPNDTSPADSKLVAVEISCPSCQNFPSLSVTTRVGPRNLETASTNGALFIEAFDANGQPVQGASVHIENNQVSPAIVIDDTTNNAGMLQIVDAPPGANAYEITVTKPGYSTERTYPPGDVANPNPVKPHATVALQQVTQASFAIDRVSTIEAASVTQTCAPVGNIDFAVTGSRLIGTTPDIVKYTAALATNASGLRTIPNLEWDTYNIQLTDAAYHLSGAIPLVPLNLGPNTTQNLQLIVAPADPASLLITVKDAGSGLPLSDAQVTIDRTGFSETLTTGRGYLRQTDWSGGSGQTIFADPTRYFSSDGNIDIANPAGDVKLLASFGNYAPSTELISSTFDTGSVSNFYHILWEPQAQPPETGLDAFRFQVSTNNDQSTWVFRGPDGMASSFYTLADTNISSVHNGDRYLRYRMLLQTASTTFTPTVAEVAFTFTSSCVPPGQVLFSNLAAPDFTLTVARAGYQTFVDTVDTSSSWQQREVLLTP